LVYVTVVVPVVNPFTTPVLDTEAIAGVDEIQAFELAAVVVADKVIDSPAPTEVVPEITGNGFITMLKSVVLTTEQTPLVTTARYVVFCVSVGVVNVVEVAPVRSVQIGLSNRCH
jgi:hypothetical protein